MAKDTIHNSKEGADATYDHIVKYTGLFGGVQGLNMLIGIVRNKITASILGPSGIGLINIFNKMTGLVNQATNLGISFSAVKHVAELSETADSEQRDGVIDTVRMWCLMTAVMGMFMGLLLSPWISLWTFGNYDYTLAFCALSSVVAMMAVTGGEIAILKGLKQLKRVALISIFAALATLLVCVPIYYCWGLKGVVAALVASNAVVLAIHLYFSSQVAPWRKTIVTIKSIKRGSPMVKLGLAYIFAGILGQGADYLILSFIQQDAGLDWVGLYNTGYFLAVGIGSMLFVAVDADFFPRLSSLVHDVKRANMSINRQVEASVLLITPCLILEVMVMPWMVRLLYTAEFMQAMPMAIGAIFFLFFKALLLPVAYLPLAKGDSWTYLFAEAVYDVFVAVAVPVAFMKYGLVGAGWALSLAGLFDCLFIYLVYGAKYGFRLSMRPVGAYLAQLALLGACVYGYSLDNHWMKWAVQGCALVASAYLTFRILGTESGVAGRIVEKVKRKIGRL